MFFHSQVILVYITVLGLMYGIYIESHFITNLHNLHNLQNLHSSPFHDLWFCL